MSGEVTIYAASVESVELPIGTNADPTGTAPAFALSTVDAVAPGSFTNGTWVGSYDTVTEQTTARTPTLGSAGSLTLASGTDYKLWAKVTLGSEVAVWVVGKVICP